MTAEIAVLNKSAIALAADSKVTVGPDGSEKTYDTANKLFTLSKYHPIGVMIYGNADIMRYPWETIIKVYREQQGKTDASTVQDYALRFLDYLRSFPFGPDLEDRNVRSIAAAIYFNVRDDLRISMFRRGIRNATDHRRLLSEIIQRYQNDVEDSSVLLDVQERDIIKKYGHDLEELAMGVFPGLADKTIAGRLALLAARHMVSDNFSTGRTGIVFAGFGSQQMFPSLREFHLDGNVMGQLKVQQDKGSDTDIDPLKETAVIIPFAVRDMADRFMDGVDRRYQRWIDRTVRGLFEENCLSIVERYVNEPAVKKRSIKAAVTKAIKKNLDEFMEKEEKYRRDRFADPVINMVELLPKEELAHLAESLVNLTSLRRRVTMDVESVGGPIDVAVISKGDGFIWIKRKHYFQAELNRSFVLNYLHNGYKGETHG